MIKSSVISVIKKIKKIGGIKMTKTERINKLMDGVFNSMGEQGHGVYDRVELDMDDFMFLMKEVEKTKKVYTVESICHGEVEGVIAAFSSEEKAEKYAEKLRKRESGYGYPVTELIIDEETE
jgi:hypothetical protein